MNKECFKCNIIKSLDNFYKHPQMPDGHVNKCKDCNKKDVSENYRKNIEYYKEYEKKRMVLSHRKERAKDTLKKWRKNNRGQYIFQLSKRRAAKLKATPKWVNLEKIKEIYLNCPKGYHVDHIIPLQGKLICGLHVHNNLQYLTKSENTSKGNRFEIG